jgi:hypothetical protein
MTGMAKLQDIKSAEEAVQNDSDHYCTLYSKEALGALVQQGQEAQKILLDFHQTLLLSGKWIGMIKMQCIFKVSVWLTHRGRWT